MPTPIAHKALIKPIQTHRATLAELERAEARTEGHYRRAFGHLLVEAASATKSGWTLLDEETIKAGRDRGYTLANSICEDTRSSSDGDEYV